MSPMRLVIILVILIGLGLLGVSFASTTSTEADAIKVALDAATKEAIDKGEFVAPEGVTFVESKDCEGTQWIKQQSCSLNGKTLDGTEGSCGPGKEIWILDPTHSDFKPATGDGKCEPQERECSVECPKPCEGDTWIDTGKCVRKEYDTRGNMIETVLDGTEGKCGEGMTQLNLDTNAPDYKPAVGTGSCPTSKGGYCNVPCPKPEPPKCNNYTGWVENTGLGCVVAENSQIKVSCGQKGKKMFYNIATNPKDCPELIKWEECTAGPCPIDCVGSWSEWSAPKSDEPCGVQPYKERTFTITTNAAHGGNVCDYPHNDTQRVNSGTPKTCCEETGDWAMVGSCLVDGTAKYTQTYKENKPGGCPSTAKAKFLACCYQKGDWKDTTGCSSIGRKTQTQTTAGNCPESVKTRQVDCPYVGPWVPISDCTPQGKQYYRRDVVNSGESTSKTENCCYLTSDWKTDGRCEDRTPGYQKYIKTYVGECPEYKVTKLEACRNCVRRVAYSKSKFCQTIGEWKNYPSGVRPPSNTYDYCENRRTGLWCRIWKDVLYKAEKDQIITPAYGTGTCSSIPDNYVLMKPDYSEGCSGAVGSKNMFGSFKSKEGDMNYGYRWHVDDSSAADRIVKANGGWA